MRILELYQNIRKLTKNSPKAFWESGIKTSWFCGMDKPYRTRIVFLNMVLIIIMLWDLLPSKQTIFKIWPNLPHQINTQYLHFRLHVKYFLSPWKIPEEISRDQLSSITKGSTYMKHTNIRLFSMVVEWPLMLNGSICCFLFLYILRFYLVRRQ